MVASVYTRCINSKVTKHQDYDRSAIDNYLLTGSCVLFTNFGTLPEFDLDAGVLSGWVCAIRCTRTSGANLPANKEFMAIVHVVGDETVNVTGTRKIFIEIPENLVNDGTLINNEVTGINDQRLGLGIAVIKSELTYPAHTNYIPLREINAGVPTDVRPLLQLQDGIFSAVPASKITGWNRKFFATNGSGVLQEVAFGSATQVLTSNWLSVLPSFQSPSIDVNWISAEDNNGYLDKLLVYVPWVGNVKRDIETVIKNIIRQCGETISAGDSVCIGKFDASSATAWWSTGDATCGIRYSTTYYVQSQSFTFGADTKIHRIKVSLRKVGSPTGTLNIWIQTAQALLQYPWLNFNLKEADLTTSFADYYFYIPWWLTFNAWVTYYLSITCDRAVNTTNYTQWAYGGSYAGGDWFRVNNFSAFTSLWSDHNFSFDTINYDDKFYKAHQYSENVVWVAVYWWATNDYIEAGIDIVNTSWLTAGAKYFLPVVAGAPTLTPTMRALWFALSTTRLKVDLQKEVPVAWTALTLAESFDVPYWRFTGTTYTKRKQLLIRKSWIYTVTFSLWWNGVAWTSYGQIYKNGVAYWTERSIASNPWTLTAFSENLQFKEGDTLEIWSKVSVGTAGVMIRKAMLQCSLMPIDFNNQWILNLE
jgi:hypothetical protein